MTKTSPINLTGREFGLLTVLEKSHSNNSVYWHLRCACGKTLVRRGGDLLVRERRGQNQSCGCAKTRALDDGLVRCTRCRKFKDRGCFSQDPSSPLGVHGHCKSCSLEWREGHRELTRALSDAWRKKNVERIKQKANEYRLKNLDRCAAISAARRARVLSATPSWADKEKIGAFYAEARRLGLEVDHIVPLLGKTVCGLHVENNLQLLSRSENSSKKNRWWPDMPTEAIA